MMQQRQTCNFCTLSIEELALLEQVYLDSFPQEERRPWQDICHNPSPLFYATPLYHAGSLCGFVTTWRLPSALFVEHLVVAPKQRGQGVGAKAIRELLCTLVDSPLILEVEPAHLGQQAQRRQTFYQRLGLELLSYEYTQPPYIIGGEPIPLCLMASKQITPAQTRRIVDELYHIVYNTTKL